MSVLHGFFELSVFEREYEATYKDILPDQYQKGNCCFLVNFVFPDCRSKLYSCAHFTGASDGKSTKKGKQTNKTNKKRSCCLLVSKFFPPVFPIMQCCLSHFK